MNNSGPKGPSDGRAGAGATRMGDGGGKASRRRARKRRSGRPVSGAAPKPPASAHPTPMHPTPMHVSSTHAAPMYGAAPPSSASAADAASPAGEGSGARAQPAPRPAGEQKTGRPGRRKRQRPNRAERRSERRESRAAGPSGAPRERATDAGPDAAGDVGVALRGALGADLAAAAAASVDLRAAGAAAPVDPGRPAAGHVPAPPADGSAQPGGAPPRDTPPHDTPRGVRPGPAAADTGPGKTGAPWSRPAGDPQPAHRRLYAALDLGTNNCRLLVARPEPRGFRVVDAFSRIVRLGEGLGHTNWLCDAAMERALAALVCCRDKLRDRGVDRFRLIATEACRAAENGPLFIERVREETGLALEIATRETEARLAVAGCASLVDPDANGVVLFDIGGGSSEIVWLDLRNRCGARGVALTRFIRAWISLPVGVVNLAERHGGRHVCENVFEAMVADAQAHLEAFALGEELSEAICDGKVHMLGTSGTVTTLAGVHFGLKRYDRRRVDGAWMDAEDVSAMIERLRAMPYEERVDNPCIGADRADLVLAGCAILEAIRRRWPCQRLRVADRGLREGMLMELMAADNVWRRPQGPRPQAPRGRNE